MVYLVPKCTEKMALSENVWFIRGLKTFKHVISYKLTLDLPPPLKSLKNVFIRPPGAGRRRCITGKGGFYLDKDILLYKSITFNSIQLYFLHKFPPFPTF